MQETLGLEELEQKLENTENPDTQLYFDLAEAYYKNDQDEKALEYFSKVLDAGEEEFLGQSYHTIGNIQAGEQEWQKALESYATAINWKEQNDKSTLGNTYRNLGTVYLQMQEWNESLHHYHEAIQFDEEQENYKELGRVFMHLRILFHYAPINEDKAIEMYREIQENAEQNGQEASIAFVNHNLGMIYEQNYKNELAKSYFETSLEYKQKLAIQFELGLTYHLCGLMLDDLGEHQKAIEYNILGLKYMLENKNFERLGIIIHFLETSLIDFENEEMKKEGEELLKTAQEKLAEIEAKAEEDDLVEEVFEELEEDENNINIAKNAEEIVKHQDKTLEELEQDFTQELEKIQGNQENWEEFMTLSLSYLNKLDESIDRSLFSVFGKKKNKAKKEKLENSKTDVLSIIEKVKTEKKDILDDWKAKTSSIEI